MSTCRSAQAEPARLASALGLPGRATRRKVTTAFAIAALAGPLAAAPPAAADNWTIAVSSAESPVEVATPGAGLWCATTTSAESGAKKWTLTLTPARPESEAITLTDRAEVGTGVCRTVPAGIYSLSVSVTGRPTAVVEVAVLVPQPTVTPIHGTPGARQGHASAPISNGRVLVTGGYLGGSAAPTQEIDPSSPGMWTRTEPLVHRREAALAALPDGRAVLVGGWTRAFDPVALVEVYSGSFGRWRSGGMLARPRNRPTATTLDDGRVLVVGGDLAGWSAEIYDPAAATSRLTAPPPLYGSVAAKLADGRVLLTASDSRGAALFDPVTEIWQPVGSTARPRDGGAGALLPDGRYLLTGGSQGASYWADGEIFDPATGTWTTTSAMRHGRSRHTATLLESGLVLVLGGRDTAGDVRSDAQLYDPVADRWTAVRSADSRSGHTVVSTEEGALVVIGGGGDPRDRFAPRDLVYQP